MLKVYSDGGSRGNPGKAAIGFVVYNDNTEIFRLGKFLGNATNNYAEYAAILLATEWLVENNYTKNITFCLDSELVVNQINKIYKVRNANIFPLFEKVSALLKEEFTDYTIIHVPRGQNKVADSIVNKVLDEN